MHAYVHVYLCMYLSVRVGLHVGRGANEVWSEMHGYYIICVYIDNCVPQRELGSNSNEMSHSTVYSTAV